MSASITVNHDHPQFGAVIALLTGVSSAAMATAAPQPIPTMPAGQPVSNDDEADDSGPVNANAPAVDANGLPWDERIHASTKTQKSDGSWTGRRGAPKGAEYDAIVAELRARVASQPAPAPIAQPMPMPSPQPIPAMPMMAPNAAPMPHAVAPMPMPAPVGMEPAGGVAAPVYSPPPMPEQVAPQPVQQPAPAPVAQPMQTAVAQATGTLDFAQFMQHLSGQMSKRDGAGAPLVHADYLAAITAEISTAFGQQLSAITDIANNPHMINFAVQAMTRDGRW